MSKIQNNILFLEMRIDRYIKMINVKNRNKIEKMIEKLEDLASYHYNLLMQYEEMQYEN
jgi:hypothetical protein